MGQKMKNPVKNGKMAAPAKKVVPKSTKKNIILQNEDGTISTIPKKELPKLQREARQDQVEQIVALSKPNTVYVTSQDYAAGSDLYWQEVSESILASKIASTNVPPPIGPAAIKAYLWWFMIDRLRSVGGLYPEPTTLVVPTFPSNGNIPSGWAKFVEYLMPYVDPLTKTTYQFRYQYIYGAPAGSATPSTTSSVLNPSAPAGDFSFSALQNFFLVPSAAPTIGSLAELTWTFVNTAFNFQTDVVANNGDISQWIASNGSFTEAQHVPYMAPDASAVCVNYAHNVSNNWNPGVYCQSRNFDPEMACIIHPPQTTITLNQAAFTDITPFDWKIAPLPQCFNAAVVKTFPAGSNLAQAGQLELITNYGYITQNTKYVVGGRKNFLSVGQKMWPGLKSYCPYYYPLNNVGYHQAAVSLINMLAVNSSNAITPAPGSIAGGTLTDPSDYMTLMCFMESKFIARTTEYAYIGLILNTTDDICSQTQFASEFRDAASNPVLEDILDTWAPTVRHGRLVLYYQDYRPVTSYGMTLNINLSAVNTNIARWIQIGNDFASANGNINDYSPQLGGIYTGYAIGPFVFNPQQTGSNQWALRGPGQNMGAPNFTTVINATNLGQTFPSLPTYALGNTICPAAPCLYGPRIILKSMEIMGAGGLGTWVSFNYAKLGGYCNQTQVSAIIEPDNTVVSTAAGATAYINLVFRYVPQKLGSYFPLDKESVGRSFAYTPRVSFNNVADRFPSLQAIGGNSSVQDALIANTQLGPGSSYNRVVQAKLTDGLDPVEACRSALGAFHVDIIPNFAGDEMVTYKAIELIFQCKQFVSVAPYHTEHAASLTSYNSPNIFDSFMRSIFDIGDRLIGTVGNVLGSVSGSGGGSFIGDLAGGVISNVLLNKFGGASYSSDFASPAVKPAIVAKIPKSFRKIVTTVKPVDNLKIRATNQKAVAKSLVALQKCNIQHSLPDSPHVPTTEEIAKMVLGQLSLPSSYFLTPK
jgi:hypothetical protein